MTKLSGEEVHEYIRVAGTGDNWLCRHRGAAVLASPAGVQAGFASHDQCPRPDDPSRAKPAGGMNWHWLVDRLTDRIYDVMAAISRLGPQDDFDTEDQLASV